MNARDWDRLARVYEHEVCDIFRRDRRGVIAGWLQRQRWFSRRRQVLDLGCGIGSFFRKFGSRFGPKTGVDHSPRMLRIAARLCRRQPDIAWSEASVLELPARLSASADLVVCANVLTFVARADCRRAARAVVRCARPGGRVLLVLPSLESHDHIRAIETGRPSPQRGSSAIIRRDDRRQRFFTAAGIRALLAGTDLRDVAVTKVWYPWIDEGVASAPRDAEPPWDWLVTGVLRRRRPRRLVRG